MAKSETVRKLRCAVVDIRMRIQRRWWRLNYNLDTLLESVFYRCFLCNRRMLRRQVMMVVTPRQDMHRGNWSVRATEMAAHATCAKYADEEMPKETVPVEEVDDDEAENITRESVTQ